MGGMGGTRGKCEASLWPAKVADPPLVLKMHEGVHWIIFSGTRLGLHTARNKLAFVTVCKCFRSPGRNL